MQLVRRPSRLALVRQRRWRQRPAHMRKVHPRCVDGALQLRHQRRELVHVQPTVEVVVKLAQHGL